MTIRSVDIVHAEHDYYLLASMPMGTLLPIRDARFMYCTGAIRLQRPAWMVVEEKDHSGCLRGPSRPRIGGPSLLSRPAIGAHLSCDAETATLRETRSPVQLGALASSLHAFHCKAPVRAACTRGAAHYHRRHSVPPGAVAA
jgi:hypothetical protein